MKHMRMTRDRLLLLLGTTLVAISTTVLDIRHNLVAWHWDGFDFETALVAVVYVFALAFIHVGTRSYRSSIWVILVMLTLCMLGVAGLPAEWGDAVKPRTPSPLTYRLVQASLRTFPLVLVLANMYRRRHTRSPAL